MNGPPRSCPRTAGIAGESPCRLESGRTLRGVTGACGDEVVHRMGAGGRAGADGRRGQRTGARSQQGFGLRRSYVEGPYRGGPYYAPPPAEVAPPPPRYGYGGYGPGYAPGYAPAAL